MVAVDNAVNAVAALGADDATMDRAHAFGAALAVSHDDAGHDEREQERQHAAPHAGHEAQRRPGQVADFRLQLLQQRRQVGCGQLPGRMEFLADNRPARHRIRGGGDHQGVVAQALHKVDDRVGERTGEQKDRDNNQNDAAQDQQRGRPTLPAAEFARDDLMQGIERHGQNHGPQHQGEERRKNLEAQRHQHGDEAGLDQHIQQFARPDVFQTVQHFYLPCGQFSTAPPARR